MSTASEFLSAFKGYPQLSLADDAYELHDLERAILRYVPDAARMAQQLADGRLSGETFSAVFVPLERTVSRVLEGAALLERRLWHARAAAGLAPRPFDADANGTSATMALLGIARRVVNVVWEAVGGWGCAFDGDDDEAPGIYEVMEWESTAGELRERFGADFLFPDPAPLLHEMRMELMQLDALVALDAPITSPAIAVIDDDAPPITQREAARRTGKSKKENKPEPLPPERPYPVYIVQPASHPVPVEVIGPTLPALVTPPPASDPPVCRLRIEGEKVFLDGKAIALDVGSETQGAALCMLGHLLAAEGGWLTARELNEKENKGACRQHYEVRWDRIRKAVQKSLPGLIESNHKGYRLSL